MKILGIDPGQEGGIAVIEDTLPIYVGKMPLKPDRSIDVQKLVFMIDALSSKIDICCIEKSQSMPKQGVKSTFRYGMGYGRLTAMLDLFEIPYEEITPQKWKKEFGLIKKSKADSVATAMKLFPLLPDDTFIGPKGGMWDGPAEALLIAEYCRRKTR